MVRVVDGGRRGGVWGGGGNRWAPRPPLESYDLSGRQLKYFHRGEISWHITVCSWKLLNGRASLGL